MPAGGLVTGVGSVHGRLVAVVANDATVKGGTYFPITGARCCHHCFQSVAVCLLPGGGCRGWHPTLPARLPAPSAPLPGLPPVPLTRPPACCRCLASLPPPQ